MKAPFRSAAVSAGVLATSAVVVWVIVEAFGGERVVATLLFWGFVVVAWLVVSVAVAFGLGAAIRAAAAEGGGAPSEREAA